MALFGLAYQVFPRLYVSMNSSTKSVAITPDKAGSYAITCKFPVGLVTPP
ncbi:hypothetical protein [Brevibacillus choshinensis]|nr:hypothetical protein [Brevibacillus choshinensis]